MWEIRKDKNKGWQGLLTRWERVTRGRMPTKSLGNGRIRKFMRLKREEGRYPETVDILGTMLEGVLPDDVEVQDAEDQIGKKAFVKVERGVIAEVDLTEEELAK